MDLVSTPRVGYASQPTGQFGGSPRGIGEKSGKLNVGSNGAGTTSYLAVEMFKQATGANVANVAYKGGGPAVIALVGGEVDFEFATALAAAAHIKSGKITALAVTTAQPSKAFPNLPTMASVFPGFNVDNWYAMFMPAGTPKSIINKLHAEILKAIHAPDVQEFMAKEGGQPVGSTRGTYEHVQARDCEICEGHRCESHSGAMNGAGLA